ncbi:MAG: M1 family metallopeptidase [Bacteroidota bacterium]
MTNSIKVILLVTVIGTTFNLIAQEAQPFNGNTRFEQLDKILPTPNTYRTASGAPGKDYFQNRADYDIKAELDEKNNKIIGSETVTFYNQSPDVLTYMWLQLDQNIFEKNNTTSAISIGGIDKVNFNSTPDNPNFQDGKDYGYKITSVKDKSGNKLRFTVNQTMMRVELPTPLSPGQSFIFSVDWNYLITEYYGRSGYEFFPKDGNYNYNIAHWFPRMCAYNDVNGWQHKQFLGQGEFTLIFGNYKVAITVPNDHIVGATGELQNMNQVLSATQIKRLEKAKTAGEPVLIVTQAEAEKAELGNPTGKKTWIYKADNVRDFAFASSRKYIWDAMQVEVEGKKTWAMSLYPKEGNPLWEKYSTYTVAHTLKSYSKRTIAYPYPVAYSVHSVSGGGMEYPMISFNGGRPEADGTYSEATKWGMIGVIIHEVGHNFFPMIVNSDERQWTWMDEGLNTFCEYLASQEFDRDWEFKRGDAQYIVPYMKTDPTQQVPIMTNSEQVLSFGSNAYAKPATALNILRETVMGRELFDYAFKEYARRWAFKQPMPADFFRTMEDASGVDLDWFWKGWFYGVEPVNLSIENVEWFAADKNDPVINKAEERKAYNATRETISNIRNRTDIPQTEVEKNPKLKDFYSTYDKFEVKPEDTRYQEYFNMTRTDEEKALLEKNKNFYVLNIKNKGGLISPVILKIVFEDGTEEVVRIPAEIWRFNDKEIKKVIPTDKKVAKWIMDPFLETADIDTSDNSFPKEPEQPSRFQIFKQKAGTSMNPMQRAARMNGGVVPGAKN